jgi:hypothetical protein
MAEVNSVAVVHVKPTHRIQWQVGILSVASLEKAWHLLIARRAVGSFAFGSRGATGFGLRVIQNSQALVIELVKFDKGVGNVLVGADVLLGCLLGQLVDESSIVAMATRHAHFGVVAVAPQ